MKANLAAVGIDLQAKALAWPTQWDIGKSEDVSKRQDIFLFYWYPDYADPFSWFVNLYRSASPPYFNLSYWDDPQVDDTIDGLQAVTATDRDEAQSQYVGAAGDDLRPGGLAGARRHELPAGDRLDRGRLCRQSRVRQRRLRPRAHAVGGLTIGDSAMLRYLGSRVLQALGVVFGVVVLTFVIARLVPGDPAVSYAGPKATPEQLAAVRVEFGLDDPMWKQFVSYLGGVFRGDLGTSLHTKQSVVDDLGQSAPDDPGARHDRAGPRAPCGDSAGDPRGAPVRAAGRPGRQGDLRS